MFFYLHVDDNFLSAVEQRWCHLAGSSGSTGSLESSGQWSHSPPVVKDKIVATGSHGSTRPDENAYFCSWKLFCRINTIDEPFQDGYCDLADGLLLNFGFPTGSSEAYQGELSLLSNNSCVHWVIFLEFEAKYL